MSDLISRQAAIDALGEEPPVWYDGEDEIAERNQWKRDIEAIKQLPPIQPKRIRGQWSIKGQAIDTVRGYWAKCSACGHAVFGGGNYCSNCGADMREVTT